MRIVRVTREEFELEDGRIFPITPKLSEDLTIEEFQEHYNFATEAVKSSRDVGSDHANP